jgi:hypothetical protein
MKSLGMSVMKRRWTAKAGKVEILVIQYRAFCYVGGISNATSAMHSTMHSTMHSAMSQGSVMPCRNYMANVFKRRSYQRVICCLLRDHLHIRSGTPYEDVTQLRSLITEMIAVYNRVYRLSNQGASTLNEDHSHTICTSSIMLIE